MNWNMEASKGEGWEYFIMIFGLSLIALILGGGKQVLMRLLKRSKNNYGNNNNFQ